MRTFTPTRQHAPEPAGDGPAPVRPEAAGVGPAAPRLAPAPGAAPAAHDFSRVAVHAPEPGPVQAKLTVNAPGDRYEQEADQVAEQVLTMSTPVRAADAPGPPRPPITPRPADAAGGIPVADPALAGAALRGAGQPLDPATRADLEPRFGHDFSRVRVHTDGAAVASAEALAARAYTAGSHIVFGAGEYAPASPAGRRLLAHELTHVAQQGAAARAGGAQAIQRQPQTKAPAPAAKEAPKPAPAKKAPAPKAERGLNRTIFVVQNDVWTSLPAEVRTAAEQELNKQFAFVGQASGEKAFTIKVLTPAQLPEQFDFSEAVVSVIHGDPQKYVDAAVAAQRDQIRRFLDSQHVTPPATGHSQPTGSDPFRMGVGLGNKTVFTANGQAFALPVMAGAVNFDDVLDSFFDNIDSNLAGQLEKVPGHGRDLSKWPKTIMSKKGTTSWARADVLAMVGGALGRVIAHEARHEYITEHAKAGLGGEGENTPIIGESHSLEFSKEDQKAILDRLHKLETQQGHARVVPTFPQDIRSDPDAFPF
jgi:hypothetical protein